MNRIFIFLFFYILFSGCGKDRLENYREEFCGQYDFTTIIENWVDQIPNVIDTVEFTGFVEPVYSNREDVISIHFMPGFIIEPFVNEKGLLISPGWWYSGGTYYNVQGFFNYGKVYFSYQVGYGENFMFYKIEGIKR